MSDIAIRVENLSKAYRITSQRQQGGGYKYKTLQEELLGVPGRLWRMARGYADGQETVWALKDVSFQVKEGEVVGIIGRNGAGKTTLLKILCRITEPTEGQATVYGRVASLLEVGTGFHPELTGRENVFLNGAILGMSRQEVQRKFDEIVDFSGVGQYVDTPVKRYSSGMQVRLAFAVAAHLEPEILLVDEVLAVGDAGFQKKCLGKMQDVSQQGRTIFFVSHNMTAIATLTRRCMELSRGVMVECGPTEQVIQHYLAGISEEYSHDGCFDLMQADRPLHKVDPKTAKAFFVRACCLDPTGRPKAVFVEGESLTIQVQFQVRAPVEILSIESSVQTTLGMRVFSMLSEVMDVSLQPGLHEMRVDLKPNYLRPGDYYGDLTLRAPDLQDGIRQALQFRVETSPEAEDNVNWSYGKLGVVRFPYRWTRPIAVSED